MDINISQAIVNKINNYQLREPILFDELLTGFEKYKEAVYTAVSRLHKKNIIETYEKGIYYKPKNTKFGKLDIDKELLIRKKYIGEKNQLGYVTGPEVWNKFGLTTQISNRKWVAQSTNRKKEIDSLKLVIIKAKANIESNNVHILQFLDILDQIDLIPDTNETSVILQLKEHYMNEFSVEERFNIFNYVESYPYKVKVLLGFIASHVKNEYFEVMLNNFLKKVKTRNKVKVNIDLSKFEIRNEWSALIETTRK
ncbi:MAG: hypothetical protein JXM74_01940 [Fusobacteriaceae bacterium]|nr:hypothetical protein [Fusobacteriaceae bacterium]